MCISPTVRLVYLKVQRQSLLAVARNSELLVPPARILRLSFSGGAGSLGETIMRLEHTFNVYIKDEKRTFKSTVKKGVEFTSLLSIAGCSMLLLVRADGLFAWTRAALNVSEVFHACVIPLTIVSPPKCLLPSVLNTWSNPAHLWSVTDKRSARVRFDFNIFTSERCQRMSQRF